MSRLNNYKSRLQKNNTDTNVLCGTALKSGLPAERDVLEVVVVTSHAVASTVQAQMNLFDSEENQI